MRRTWLYPATAGLLGVLMWKLGATVWIASLVIAWLIGREVEHLRATASLDPLTNLPNRRHFLARLQQEVSRASRYGTHLSLLLVDVDHLKAINDRSGHAGGDRALLGVAEALRQACRSSDLAGRIGGDEFAVVAPLTRVHAARVLGNRIRQRLRDGGPVAATVSIGIADLERAGTPGVERVWAAADEALYAAKAAGRDRVLVAAGPKQTRRIYAWAPKDRTACALPRPVDPTSQAAT
jgi:diguanylate cyclase (GGDEF)-like protein